MVTTVPPPAMQCQWASEPITFEPCRHDEHGPAQPRRRGLTAPRKLSVSGSAQWTSSTVTRSGRRSAADCDQGGDHALFAVGSRRGVHRLVEFSGRLGVRDLKQIPQIERVIRFVVVACSSIFDRAFDCSAVASAPAPIAPATTVRTAPCPARFRNRARSPWCRSCRMKPRSIAIRPSAAFCRSRPRRGSVRRRRMNRWRRRPATARSWPSSERGRPARRRPAPHLEPSRSPGLDGWFETLSAPTNPRLHRQTNGWWPINGIGNERLAARPLQQPRRDVRRLAGDGIAAMMLASDRACDHFTCRDPDVDGKRKGQPEASSGTEA